MWHLCEGWTLIPHKRITSIRVQIKALCSWSVSTTRVEWVMFSSSSFNYSLCAPLTVGEMRHAQCEMVCYWWGRAGYHVQSVRETTSAIKSTSSYLSTLAFFFFLFSDLSQRVTFKLLLSERCSKPELNKQSGLRHMKLDLELMVVMLHSLSESANKQSTSLLQRGQVNKECNSWTPQLVRMISGFL